MLLPLLLLLCTGALAAAAVTVRRHVPNGKSCCWFNEYESMQVSFFSSFKHDIFLTYIPLGGTVAFTASVCLYYILGSYGHARSQGSHQWCAVFFTSFFCLSRVVSQPSTSTVGRYIPGTSNWW